MSAAPRRVLFLAPSIRAGGMERLVSILLRTLDRDRYHAELLLLHRIAENAAYRATIPDDLPIHDLGKRSRADLPRLLRDVRRRLSSGRYAAALGFMTYPNLLLLAAGVGARRRVPVVATEHVTPDALRATPGKRAQLALAAPLYRRAARLVAVSDGMRDAFVRTLRLPPGRVDTIYNPFDPALDDRLVEPVDDTWLSDGEPLLVAVGRLAPQKGYPVMLRALAEVRRDVPARLLVLGDGDERGQLTALSRELGVEDAVRFAGFVENPFPYMRAATAYVLSSHWEGFPFVLVEASRAGAAIVAANCPFGVDEVIVPEETGLLVPPGDPGALAAAILRVLRDPRLAARLRQGARERSERFAPDLAAGQYADLLDEVIDAP
jgi:glycosyltransferase involved in cell wall biosynthesis